MFRGKTRVEHLARRCEAFACAFVLSAALSTASFAIEKSTTDKPAADQSIKTPSQKESDSRRAEHRDRIDRIVRDSEERFEALQQTRLNQNPNYARARDAYEKAHQNKHDDPALIHAAIGFAIASHNARDYAKASALYTEAADAYIGLDKSNADELECRRDIWSRIGYLPSTTFKEKFAQLFKILEQRTSGNQLIVELDNAISRIPSDQRSNYFGARVMNFGTARESFDDKEFWKTAIEIRSSVRGPNDASLYSLLERYVNACEQNNEIAEAEHTYLRLLTLKNKDSADAEVKVQVDLARFYLRHSMQDKAEAAYHKALSLSKNQVTRKSVSQLLSLASDFKGHSRAALSDEIIIDLLASGGDETVQSVDSTLNAVVSGYLNSFQLTKAQALLVKRVEASKTCSNDHQANHWRLKLSDIDLALGQEAESNRLFDQVKTTMALTNGNVDKLLEDRKKLIETLKTNKQSQPSTQKTNNNKKN